MSLSEELKPCPFCGCDGWIVEDRGDHSCEPLLYRPQCKMCGGGLGGFQYRDNAIMVWNTRADGDAYEPTDAEVREGESLDSVSYVIRRGETDETAFRRAARAEIVRLRRVLSDRAEGVAALQQAGEPVAKQCQTPGATYSLRVGARALSVGVSLPPGVQIDGLLNHVLDKGESSCAAIEDIIHDAVEPAIAEIIARFTPQGRAALSSPIRQQVGGGEDRAEPKPIGDADV